MMYDVHSYTPFLQKYVPLIADSISQDLPSESEIDQLLAKLVVMCPRGSSSNNIRGDGLVADCDCQIALQALLRHRPVYDEQLPAHHPLDLRLLLFRCAQYAFAADEITTLHETLYEIGDTCVQGQSHRLMYLYLAWNDIM